MLEINGNAGGGSVVRIAVALSAMTQKPCKITHIREKRANPGMQAQHIAAVKAVATMCDASVTGCFVGSSGLEFTPKEMKGRTFELAVGTAGSIALVLQAIMIAALAAKEVVRVKITGGTVNKWAPSLSYLQNVTLPILKKMGYDATVNVIKHGFYPKGGGIVEAIIKPRTLKPVNLTERGGVTRVLGTALASSDLKKGKVTERMAKTATIEGANIKAEYTETLSTGGIIDMFAQCEYSVLGVSVLAERDKSAESVGKEAASLLQEAIESNAAVDEHMADQILPFLAVAGGAVRVPRITEHCIVNMNVINQFLKVPFSIKENIIKAEKSQP